MLYGTFLDCGSDSPRVTPSYPPWGHRSNPRAGLLLLGRQISNGVDRLGSQQMNAHSSVRWWWGPEGEGAQSGKAEAAAQGSKEERNCPKGGALQERKWVWAEGWRIRKGSKTPLQAAGSSFESPQPSWPPEGLASHQMLPGAVLPPLLCFPMSYMEQP